MTNAKRRTTVPTITRIVVVVVIAGIYNRNPILFVLGHGICTCYPCQSHKIKTQYVAGNFHYCKYMYLCNAKILHFLLH
ncbi:hypothetical protein SAMN02927921_00870 [Sinomicrobium oceani]|uniref:Uncharacterized protein n=1 Tax=Sinomicrobium oceani TaxID=1150368 RepID=A0A1K1MUW0_9FLAO|nr:hypothetical protein SAMN02927921_00870 [Sinomicrobium oceani]